MVPSIGSEETLNTAHSLEKSYICLFVFFLYSYFYAKWKINSKTGFIRQKLYFYLNNDVIQESWLRLAGHEDDCHYNTNKLKTWGRYLPHRYVQSYSYHILYDTRLVKIVQLKVRLIETISWWNLWDSLETLILKRYKNIIFVNPEITFFITKL